MLLDVTVYKEVQKLEEMQTVQAIVLKFISDQSKNFGLVQFRLREEEPPLPPEELPSPEE